MPRFQGDLPARTFQFSLGILDLVADLPANTVGWTIGKQLARCGTSIGANVREADHALTDAEFTYICNVARKEAAETLYWLQICEAKQLLKGAGLDSTLKEAHELLLILSTIVRKMHHHVSGT